MLIFLISCASVVAAQQKSDSTKKKAGVRDAGKVQAVKTDGRVEQTNQDSVNKIRLVSLAMNNPNMRIADANIRIAERDLEMARLGYLSSLSLGANINEFVIRNSSAASFFPKYNFGISVPFDIISRNKRERRVAEEKVTISNEVKKDRMNFVKTEVLIRYENYKEKKENVFLQRTYMEYDFSAYESAQKSYADGNMTLEEMNKSYQAYILERSKLVSKERDLNIAIIQLEEMIGVPLAVVIPQ